MTNYKKGVKFEYIVRDYYLGKGYFVMRAAGSKGAADLIAWTESDVVVIQCKQEEANRGLYTHDVSSLQSLKTPDNFRKLLWVKRKSDIFIKSIDHGGVFFETRTTLKEVKALAKVGEV